MRTVLNVIMSIIHKLLNELRSNSKEIFLMDVRSESFKICNINRPDKFDISRSTS